MNVMSVSYFNVISYTEPKKEASFMPIVLAPVNTELEIIKILADDKTRMRLESLGITAGGNVTLLSSSGGTVVCKVKDGKIALDRDLSTKILVK